MRRYCASAARATRAASMVPFNGRARPGNFIARYGDIMSSRMGPAPRRLGAGLAIARPPTSSACSESSCCSINNGLNALSDLPLRRRLRGRDRAGCSPTRSPRLAAIEAEGIRPVSPTPIRCVGYASVAAARRHILGSAQANHEDRSGALACGRPAAGPTGNDYLQASSPISRRKLQVPLAASWLIRALRGHGAGLTAETRDVVQTLLSTERHQLKCSDQSKLANVAAMVRLLPGIATGFGIWQGWTCGSSVALTRRFAAFGGNVAVISPWPASDPLRSDVPDY